MSPFLFLRRTQAAVYQGVYAQAREFFGTRRRDRDAPVRIAQRQGCMRECTGGGAFLETVVCTLFGYLPKLAGAFELPNRDTPRGFFRLITATKQPEASGCEPTL